MGFCFKFARPFAARAVGAPSPRLDAVLRAGQAHLGAPTGGKFLDAVQMRLAENFVTLQGTPDPLQAFIKQDALDAYDAVQKRLKNMVGLYEMGTSSMHPTEETALRVILDYLPMLPNEKDILQSRLVEIQDILATSSRPRRNVDDNPEYVEVLTKYIKHIDEIFKYQLSPDAKAWRLQEEGVW